MLIHNDQTQQTASLSDGIFVDPVIFRFGFHSHSVWMFHI